MDNRKPLVSHKSGSELHGIGIISINSIVDKYNGTMKWSCEDYTLTIDILLCL